MNRNNHISIHDVLKSDSALTPTAGDIVYNLIVNVIEKKKNAVVDFGGIKHMTTAFLNAAIGQLYRTLTREELNKRVSLTNMRQSDLDMLELVLERARDYFKNKDDFENGVNSSLDNL